MKKLIVALLTVSLIPISAAERKRTRKAVRPKTTNSRLTTRMDRELATALKLAKSRQYAEASKRLFQLSYSPRFRNRRMQIKYILGMMLHQLQLNQVAAFQFIGVVKDGNNRYIKQSLEKLSLAADALGDDTLLNYAISRVSVDDFPRVHRDMLSYRIGEYQIRNRQYREAAKTLARVSRGHGLYSEAKYRQGLALAQAGDLTRALSAFEELIQARRSATPTDSAKVAAMMGKARVLYQKQAWDESIEAYRQVPRDSEFWHDTVFESSWAMLRSGRFRSAISNFQTLHSAFYEDFYLPESLLLRSIVYLYICKYDEMDKVLDLFSRIYKPVYERVDQLLKTEKSPERFFNNVNNIVRIIQTGDIEGRDSTPIPYLVAQKITREGDFQNTFQYIHKLIEEKKRIDVMGSGWSDSPVGRYAKKVLNTRIKKAKVKAGKIVRNHLLRVREELLDQIEQEGFARYEMINGRKEFLKKRIAGKDLPDRQVDENTRRDFYVQNGYEYWPFSGEYWLDELGNYHYVGTQSCN